MGTASIPELIKEYVTVFKRWVTDVSDLGKAEMSEQGTRAGIGAGMFIGAAFLGVFAFGLVSVALAYVLVAIGLPVWAGFLIIGVLYIVIALVLALVGKSQLSGMSGPQRTISAIKAGPGFPLGGSDEDEPASPPAA